MQHYVEITAKIPENGFRKGKKEKKKRKKKAACKLLRTISLRSSNGISFRNQNADSTAKRSSMCDSHKQVIE